MKSLEDYQLIIIGGGLSGLAAGIRTARFGQKVLILEQHHFPGGLNSFYYRQGHILETGLHAMTNFAEPSNRHAPLNRLFRQLKLSRKKFQTHEQIGSEIKFQTHGLRFNNDFSFLESEIEREFPGSLDHFRNLAMKVQEHDPFALSKWQSTREILSITLRNKVLEDMLLLPLMVYGNSEEHDMDFGQFVIMFRSIFLEGFFRPEGTIRDFLDMLVEQYKKYDGEIRFQTKVAKIVTHKDRIQGVLLESGEEISCRAVLSTVGIPGTAHLSDWPLELEAYSGKMSFMESISILPSSQRQSVRSDSTIIFYNNKDEFHYSCPDTAIDDSWGVICFPENFQALEEGDVFQVRVTNPANYEIWRQAGSTQYEQLKTESYTKSQQTVGKIIGNYWKGAVFQDSFTPTTIERYTAKAKGAVYGSPLKIKDGCTPWQNLFIAGTDQGYLGIIGSMLSGVTIVNQQLLQ